MIKVLNTIFFITMSQSICNFSDWVKITFGWQIIWICCDCLNQNVLILFNGIPGKRMNCRRKNKRIFCKSFCNYIYSCICICNTDHILFLLSVIRPFICLYPFNHSIKRIGFTRTCTCFNTETASSFKCFDNLSINLISFFFCKIVICINIFSTHELVPPYSRTLWSFNHFNPDFM